MNQDRVPEASVPLGVEGLDSVLAGGLPPNRVYLIEGDPEIIAGEVLAEVLA